MTYRCTPCTRSFASPASLRQHLKTSAAHPYCAPCDSGFQTDAGFHAHRRSKHEPECRPCRSTFRTWEELDAHWQTAQDAHPHCTPCGLAFEEYRSFTRHLEHKHACIQCPACPLEVVGTLEDHYLNSPRHPSCSACSLGFVDDTAFTEHVVSAHADAHCLPCRRQFDSPSQLGEHQIRSGRHPVCNPCSRGFVDDAAYNEHARRVHPPSRPTSALRIDTTLALPAAAPPLSTASPLSTSAHPTPRKPFLTAPAAFPTGAGPGHRTPSGLRGLRRHASATPSEADLTDMANAFFTPSPSPAKARADELPVLPEEGESDVPRDSESEKEEEEDDGEWEADLGAALADLSAQFGIRVPVPSIRTSVGTAASTPRLSRARGLLSEVDADEAWDLGDSSNNNSHDHNTTMTTMTTTTTRTTSSTNSPATPVALPAISVCFGTIPALTAEALDALGQEQGEGEEDDVTAAFAAKAKPLPAKLAIPAPGVLRASKSGGGAGSESAISALHLPSAKVPFALHPRLLDEPDPTHAGDTPTDARGGIARTWTPPPIHRARGIAAPSLSRLAASNSTITAFATAPVTPEPAVPEMPTERAEPAKVAEKTRSLVYCRECGQDPCVVPTATMCGHVFCKGCIEDAVIRTSKCPVCGQAVLLYCLFKLDLGC